MEEGEMIAIIALVVAAFAGSSARENRKGLEAWQNKDTASAIKHLENAAKDTTDPRYGYNLGTVKSLAGRPDAEAAFDRPLQIAKDSSQRARILYNRGTSRLEKARSGQGDPASAAQDFRDALKLKPGWKEAGRNLELALRMAQQQQQKQKPPPKDDKSKDKKDPGNQQKNQAKDQDKPRNPRDSSDQQQPKPQPNGMDKQDAQRLLDAAKAQEGKQLKRSARKEATDGPDW
jgi:Ca-activated chloride channel homolog